LVALGARSTGKPKVPPLIRSSAAKVLPIVQKIPTIIAILRHMAYRVVWVYALNGSECHFLEVSFEFPGDLGWLEYFFATSDLRVMPSREIHYDIGLRLVCRWPTGTIARDQGP